MNSTNMKSLILERLDFADFYRKELPDLKNGRGDEATARCPFHKETDPSFSVNLKSGLFNCFGCNEGGDVFTFYQKRYNCSFNAALKDLARMYGVDQVQQKPKQKIIATYDYHDAEGKLIFQVVRFEPKGFCQRRPDGEGGWIWGLSAEEYGRRQGGRDWYKVQDEQSYTETRNFPACTKVPYHLPEVFKAQTVLIPEGEKDADNLACLGLPEGWVVTTNPQGAGKWPEDFKKHFSGKSVIILPDNDPAGRDHAQKVARNLHDVVASGKVVKLPGLPAKGDVSDWIKAGGTVEQLKILVEAAPEWIPQVQPADQNPTEPEGHRQEEGEPERIPWVGHFYCVQGGRLSLAVYDGKKWEYKPLANFQARITEEVTRDDGLKRSKEFKITGSLDTGQPLLPVQIPAKEYDSLNWVRREWGAAATVAPGRSHGPHLVNAIQAHSRGFKRRMVYAHTGWREINGVWRYLHGGGAIGPGEMVEVDVGENLSNYRLPEPGGQEAAQASLRFLDIGPWEIMVPLLTCVYLVPFADLLKIDFSLWLYGPTGGFKSTLAALALSHFGDFNRLTLPGSWFSTENSLEKLTFILKDSLVVIDDFIPASNPKEAHSMSAKAGRLIYQAGNRSSRGRLAPDLTARPNHFPRGLIISTGEILLPGQRQSATARYLGVELDPKKTPIDKARLTAAQREQAFYPQAMAAYLERLAPQLDDTQTEIKDLWAGYRTAFQSGAHMRIPEIQAWLAVGFEMFLRFQARMGVITEDQAYEMFKQAWKVFEVLGEKHSRVIEGQRPTLKFLAILRELFYQGRVYVESATVAGAPPQAKETLGWEGIEPAKNAELVGWAADGVLYLMPEMTIKVVHETIRRQGDFLSLGKNDLLAALAREGFIEPARGENTQIKWIQGASKRVICLPLVKLTDDEAMENEKT